MFSERILDAGFRHIFQLLHFFARESAICYEQGFGLIPDVLDDCELFFRDRFFIVVTAERVLIQRNDIGRHGRDRIFQTLFRFPVTESVGIAKVHVDIAEIAGVLHYRFIFAEGVNARKPVIVIISTQSDIILLLDHLIKSCPVYTRLLCSFDPPSLVFEVPGVAAEKGSHDVEDDHDDENDQIAGQVTCFPALGEHFLLRFGKFPLIVFHISLMLHGQCVRSTAIGAEFVFHLKRRTAVWTFHLFSPPVLAAHSLMWDL